MGDKGQFYHEGFKEVKQCKLLTLDIRETVGPIAITAFNDSKDASIQSYLEVGFELQGKVQVEFLILN